MRFDHMWSMARATSRPTQATVLAATGPALTFASKGSPSIYSHATYLTDSPCVVPHHRRSSGALQLKEYSDFLHGTLAQEPKHPARTSQAGNGGRKHGSTEKRQ